MKRQPKRCLAVLLALLTLFSCLSVGVSALNVGDTVRISGSKEWISGFYYDFSGSGLGTNKYGQHQYLHTEDGRPAYCIEPNEHFTDGTKTIRDSVDSHSQDVRDKISFAELYGYGGNGTKYGYSWETEYVATWGIVWSLVLGHFDGAQEEAYLNHVFGGKTSAENRANAKAVYAKIKEQILSHKTVPSLPNVGFRIRNEQGEIIRESYTDESGIVEFDKLQKGKYTYQEFAAADGYVLDETEYPFEITDEQTVVRINMTNTPIPVEIPKTGESAAVWLTVTATAVLLSAAWVTLSQRKRKSKV